jgi:hypothetical protein
MELGFIISYFKNRVAIPGKIFIFVATSRTNLGLSIFLFSGYLGLFSCGKTAEA